MKYDDDYDDDDEYQDFDEEDDIVYVEQFHRKKSKSIRNKSSQNLASKLDRNQNLMIAIIMIGIGLCFFHTETFWIARSQSIC